MKNLCVTAATLALLVGCAGETPESILGETPTAGAGPRVVFDLTARPLPLIPLPNDVATRLDKRSVTGRFVNVSHVAPTFLESDTRVKADMLDGFGTFMPITVAFDAPLDLKNVVTRHHDNEDPSDDVAYLVDIDPASPEYGKRWPLDLGDGNFPMQLEKRNNYFENDGYRGSSNIMFEVVNEDLNGNGVLDPGEDRDWDGILDIPNYIDPDASPESFLPDGYALGELLCEEEQISTDDFITYANLATFWEEETYTLIMRPLMPLRPATKYALVLTTRLVGRDGAPVRSPWGAKHHAGQFEDMKAGESAILGLGLKESDIAFAWSYTTGSTTRELEWVRAGLYGHGKMAYLEEQYPLDSVYLDLVSTSTTSPYYAEGDKFNALLPLLAAELFGTGPGADAVLSDMKTIGGVVLGRVSSPNFLVDRDGIATEANPADDDEIFHIDPEDGSSIQAPADVTWWCILPKRTAAHGNKPFKTIIYGHGYTSTRVEAVGFAGRAARFGMATCGLDAFGHGLVLPDDKIQLGDVEYTFEELLTDFLPTISDLGPFAESLLKGRARDLDNDGQVDSGGDFWTADIFHTRDVVRQTIVDHMQFIRLFRAFDGERTWIYDTNGDGFGNLAGDFDGDGIVDLGGPGDNYYVWGQSLGGIIAAVLAGIEPALVAAAPTAGAAGLTDVGARSRQGGVPEAVFLPLMGPFVVANPAAGGQGLDVKWLVNRVNNQSHHPFGTLESARPGDRVEVHNLDNKEIAWAVVPVDQRFRIPIPADALTGSERRPLLGLDNEGVEAPVRFPDTGRLGDRIEIRVFDGNSQTVKDTLRTFEQNVDFVGTRYPTGAPLVAIAKGLGLKRNSPSLRRMLSISQMILEGGDPVSFAPHYDKPLDFSYDEGVSPGVNVLVIPTSGDMNVPVNTGVQIARAAGFIELEEANPAYAGTQFEGMSTNRMLIETFTLEAIECLPRYRNADGQPVLFDVDDLDHGANVWGEPGLPEVTGGKVPPLRLKVPATHPAGGVHGMRMPMVKRRGNHGFEAPAPHEPYDVSNYMVNLVHHYFLMDGKEIVDDPCLEDSSCTMEKNGFELPFPQAEWESKDYSTKE